MRNYKGNFLRQTTKRQTFDFSLLSRKQELPESNERQASGFPGVFGKIETPRKGQNTSDA
jgi:hypothetical protein